MAKPALKLPSQSNAAGISGGTGFTGLVMLMPDSILRSSLLILAPAITVIISIFWVPFTQEVEMRVADWRIAHQRRVAKRRYELLLSESSPDDPIVQQAKQTYDALRLLEIQIAHKRAQAIVA